MALSPEEVTSRLTSTREVIHSLIKQNPVVVFCVSSCCISLVVRELFSSLGVRATYFDIDADCDNEAETERILARLAGSKQPIPLIFVGGKLIGGLESLMAAHISGKLVQQLKEARAFFHIVTPLSICDPFNFL